jgi:hypothetical protein
MSDAHRRRTFREQHDGKPLELPDAPSSMDLLECSRLGITYLELQRRRGVQHAATRKETRQALKGARRDGAFALGSIPGLDGPASSMLRELPLPGQMGARMMQPITVGDPIVATRNGDALELILRTPPRTKKNHGATVVTASVAYSRFLLRAGELFTVEMRARLGLPLPATWYNCAALFHVDNEKADTVGLMQGLADVLEALGVVVNDRWIRTWDGTDQCTDRDRPRVELRLVPKGDR